MHEHPPFPPFPLSVRLPKVSATANYNVTLRYASASIGKANLFLDAYTCSTKENRAAFLGSSVMPNSGGATGPFARTAPFTVGRRRFSFRTTPYLAAR